jgi:predicted nucleic acid-binding Zn ribbon protein
VSAKKRPERVDAIVQRLLDQAGLSPRVAQAQVVPEWPRLVGPQIAAVTEPISVTPDGVLFVGVTTHAWMTELSLLEPELLRSLNTAPDRPAIRRIRWLLRRS